MIFTNLVSDKLLVILGDNKKIYVIRIFEDELIYNIPSSRHIVNQLYYNYSYNISLSVIMFIKMTLEKLHYKKYKSFT